MYAVIYAPCLYFDTEALSPFIILIVLEEKFFVHNSF